MPDVTRRRTGEFVRNLFAILIQKPEGMLARDALAALRAFSKTILRIQVIHEIL
ncbi:MAG: hypothetical protein JNJ77_13495 [Planctomycetia bacterium]|nr:hypothetical protein [Planctomycetia bacterium]